MTPQVRLSDGKIKPLKLLQRHAEFVPVFSRLGNSEEILEGDLTQLEEFVCKMYHPRTPTYSDINKLRIDSFRQKFQPKASNVITDSDGVDLSLLPPCRGSLKMHVLRAHYQALVWKSACDQFPELPSPVGHGWIRDDDGHVSYQWTEGNILPPELIDILAEATDIVDESTDEDSDVDQDIEFNSLIDAIYDEDTDIE